MARRPALGFIFITLVLDILGLGLIIPILPQVVETLHGNGLSGAATIYGMLAALYALMQFICAPILGSLSDRYGRRRVILISLFGAGIDYFLLAFAPNLVWFFIGRAIAGITGANFAAATAYIADISPPEKRAANFGLIGAAFGLGFIVGPAMGGVLGEIGLRVPFFVAGGLTLLNWIYGLVILPESLAPENRRHFSWSRANPVSALLHLRRHRLVFVLAIVFFLISIAHQVLPSTWALYTGYRYGWGPTEIGWSLALVGLMAAIVQGGLTRKVMPRLGEPRAALLGMSVSALAFICYGLAPAGWMLSVIIVFGSLGGLTGPAIQGLISRSVGDHEQGATQGAVTSLASVAGFLGPLVATSLFGFFISQWAPFHLPGAAFFFSAGLIAASVFLAAGCFRRLRDGRSSPSR